MRLWLLASLIETVVFISVGLLLWFMPDTSGLVNAMTSKPVSLSIWCALFLCIYVGNLVWLFLIKKR